MNVLSLSEEEFKITGKTGMPALGRKERDRQLRQLDILRAAEHVFATKGYHKAAIQDIAREAQYATGTLYLYFKDKEALYLALLEIKIQHFLSAIKEKVKEVQGADEKIKVLIYEQLAYFQENQDFFGIYFSEHEGMRWTIRNKISASAVNKFIQHLDYVASLIKKAQEENIIRNDSDCRQLAQVLSAVINSVIMRWFKREPQKKEDLKAASAFIWDIFLNGAGQKR